MTASAGWNEGVWNTGVWDGGAVFTPSVDRTLVVAAEPRTFTVEAT